jgi:DNA-binding MarR family transcriptional regulator
MPKPYYTVETLEAGTSIGFLVKRCGVLMTQIAERRFETTSVSFTQWIALMHLGAHAGHMSATQLSKELGYDMGALTRVVDELERRGLLRRERSRRDRRAVEIAVTAAGRRQAESAKRMIVELLNELVDPYSDTEIATLIDLMQRMLVRLQTVAAATSAADTTPANEVRQPRRRAKSGGLA